MSQSEQGDSHKPTFPHGQERVQQADAVEMRSDDGDPQVVVTRAFCPEGHELIVADGDRFDGFHGIAIEVRRDEREGVLYLSPIHGDSSKTGFVDFELGEDVSIHCPECKTELPVIGRCSCEGRGRLYALFLSQARKEHDVVGLCSIWGCPRSRVMDNWEIISEIVLQESDEA